jgi:hypothetical protein
MQHQVCIDEIGDISAWLQGRLSAVPAGQS